MRMPPAVHAFILTFAMIVHAGAPAAAQESALAPGTRVRLTLRNGDPHAGRVIALGPDLLEIGFPENGGTASYPLTDIAKLEVLRGRHRPVLRGLLLGTGAGIVLGGAIGAMAYSPCTSTEFLGCLLAPETRAQSAALGATLAGAAGLIVGGLQGLIPRDRWQRVQVNGNAVRVNMRALPSSRTGLGLALAF